MSSFQAYLIREKTVFIDESDGGKAPITIRSNRVVLKLHKGQVKEVIVVRGYNMHGTLRMASQTFLNFYRGGGPFLDRLAEHNWESQWKKTISPYEEEYGPGNWSSVYIGGDPVFASKKMPFLDVLEKSSSLDPENYESAIHTAEQLLRAQGQQIKIKVDTNVATTLTDEVDFLRCGIILRTSDRNTQFSFILNGGETRTRRITHGFLIAADFLEAINLGFLIERAHDRLYEKEITSKSPEAKQAKEAVFRQGDMNRELKSLEQQYAMRYRPERPNFFVDAYVEH